MRIKKYHIFLRSCGIFSRTDALTFQIRKESARRRSEATYGCDPDLRKLRRRKRQNVI